VYYGGPSGLSTLPTAISSPADAGLGFFGSAVSGAGDIDRDGFADFVIGAYYTQNGAGGVAVYGGKDLLLSPPDVLQGPGGSVYFYGISVALDGHRPFKGSPRG
jgi:hypothetical protein